MSATIISDNDLDQNAVARDSTAHDSTAHDSTAHDSTAHDSTAHDSTAHDSTSNDTAAHDTAAHDTAAQDGAAQDSTNEDAPDATPAPGAPQRSGPRHPRLRRALRFIRTTVVVFVLVTAAATGGTYLVQQRLAAKAFVDVGTAVLTAQPIAVGAADAGVVKEVLVADRASVTAGAALATVTLTANGTSAEPEVRVLRAPAAGIVTAIDVAPGEVARAGEPVITLYDPAKMSFVVRVPLQTLRRLRLGMTAAISGPGLRNPVSATLDQVVPKVDAAGSDPSSDALTVILKPDRADLDTVLTLVPGLTFDVVVDTTTAAGRTPAVNSA
jgi:acetyl/propionyl-CoA carboxylase alpha subunit